MIETADVNVIDVQQQVAVGALGDGGKEFPFRHRVLAVGDVARQVFDQHLLTDKILHPRNPLCDVLHRLLGVGQRQQVMHVPVVDPGPAQVIGKPAWLDTVDQGFELCEVVEIEFVGAAEGHGDAMHHHRVVAANRVEEVERLAAVDQVILAEDFEPVDVFRFAIENVLVVLGAQTQAETQEGFRLHTVAASRMTVSRKLCYGIAPRLQRPWPWQVLSGSQTVY